MGMNCRAESITDLCRPGRKKSTRTLHNLVYDRVTPHCAKIELVFGAISILKQKSH